MRELKLRAWLDEYKQYLYFGGDYKEQTGRWGKGRCALLGNNYIAELYANEDNSNMFYQVHKVECIEQYTGSIDKNGKEIYEGDILHSKVGIDYAVSYSVDKGRYEMWSKDGYGGGIAGAQYIKEFNIEVIGNIHETPELLEREEG